MTTPDLRRDRTIPLREWQHVDWLVTALPTGELRGEKEIARRGECSAFFDGVLDNRHELERRLGLSGTSDSELVAEAYRRWGDRVLSEIKGRCSYLVGDSARGRVLCVRDRLGIHPLFYAARREELLLSNAIDTLLGDPRVPGDVDRLMLANHLAHRWPDTGATYMAAVRRVPPGHVLVLAADGQRVERYWDPIPTGMEIPWVQADELEQFDVLFEQAVERALEFGKAGVFLSGGLDSVSVAAVAADTAREAGAEPPLALSLGFSHETANEQAIQRAVAQDLGLPQLLVPLEEAAGSAGLIAGEVELNRRLPAPVLNLWLPAYEFLAAQGREQGCRVILGGAGGDEWLSVSPYYAADLICKLDFVGLYRLWLNLRRSYSLSSLRVAWNCLWRFGARPLLGYAGRRTVARRAFDARRRGRGRPPDWVAPDPQLREAMDEQAQALQAERPRPGEMYQAEINRSFDHALVSADLEEVFELGRRLGVRFAYPFWDADLVSFLCRTPPELLNQGGRSKGVVRSMLGRRFPELGFERQRKVAATVVARKMFVDEAGAAWRRLGGATTLAALGVVDGAAVSRLIEGLLDNSKKPEENVHSYQIWDIVSLEAWARARV